MLLETDVMADELKDVRIPVMMAATDVAAIDEWRRKQPDLPSRSEAIRRLIELGLLEAKGK
jgi:metal-responsive CopG/Arc/MetJ family transcriptional regulator